MLRSTLIASLVLAVACVAATSTLAAGPVASSPKLTTPALPPQPPVGPTTVTTPETIDLDAFAQGIASRLDGHVVGFTYAIARNGVVVRRGFDGLRRTAADGDQAPFTNGTMAQTASAAKTITAAALLKALHENGLSPDSEILPYLPRCWKKGPNVSGLTFRDVLGHHTLLPEGTNCSADPLGCLLEMVAKGRPARRDTGEVPYAYSNSAYALVRVLLPFVRNPVAMQARFGLSKARCSARTEQLNTIVSDRFRDYVFDHVLAPIGVEASFYPQGDGIDDYALVYNVADPTQPGIAPRDDFHLHAGAGYLAVSATGFARFLSALEAGLILPNQLVKEMTGVPGNRMGFDTTISGTLGDYVWKNGGCPNKNGIKCASIAIVFPNGMQAYIAINSSVDATYAAGALQTVARNAFDAALL